MISDARIVWVLGPRSYFSACIVIVEGYAAADDDKWNGC